MKPLFAAAHEVSEIGFVQPEQMPRVMLEHGVFVLPSRFEPWGVSIAEAQYAGLPVICTEACGASVELVRDRANGLLIPTANSSVLAAAMRWMHEHHDALASMGQIGKSLAKPFAAPFWADRLLAKFREIRAN